MAYNKPRVVWRSSKIVYQAGQQICFWQIEQRVEHVDSGLIKNQEFVGIQLVHLRTNGKKTHVGIIV